MELRGFGFDTEAHATADGRTSAGAHRARRDLCRCVHGCGHPALAAAGVPSTPKQTRTVLETLLTSEELAAWARTEKSGHLSTKRSELKRAMHYRADCCVGRAVGHRQGAVRPSTADCRRGFRRSPAAFTRIIGSPAPFPDGLPARDRTCSRSRAIPASERCSCRPRAMFSLAPTQSDGDAGRRPYQRRAGDDRGFRARRRPAPDRRRRNAEQAAG